MSVPTAPTIAAHPACLLEPAKRALAPRSHFAVRRRWSAVACCMVLMALAIETWLVKGVLVGIFVASNSMSPALVGPHYRWQCPACRLPFDCAADSLPAEGDKVVCPNCGMPGDPGAGVRRRGTRVLVDRASLWWRSPRRWEAIVFRGAGESALCVKRVVGLPGETIEIRQGDIFVDGQIATKDLFEARALAVDVHRMAGQSNRWRAYSGSAWRITDGQATFQAPGQDADAACTDGTVDWLAYEHHQGFAAHGRPSADIVDESPTDQNESRVPNSVRDVGLCCRVRAGGTGALHLRIGSGDQQFTAKLPVGGPHGELTQNGRVIAGFAIPRGALSRGTLVELMLVDRRVLLAVDGNTILGVAYQPTSRPEGAPPQSLAIGARGADVEVSELRVVRDVVYQAGCEAKYRLGDGEYFVLGDNSPHALDSRTAGPVPAQRIVGRAVWW